MHTGPCEVIIHKLSVRAFASAERHPAEQHARGAAGGEGGAAALGQGAGGRAGLAQAAGPAPPQLRGARAAEEQHGAGQPAGAAAAAGSSTWPAAPLTAPPVPGGAVRFLRGCPPCVSHQTRREAELAQKLQAEQFCLLQCAVVEAEGIILDAAAKLDDPIHVSCTSSPGKTKPSIPLPTPVLRVAGKAKPVSLNKLIVFLNEYVTIAVIIIQHVWLYSANHNDTTTSHNNNHNNNNNDDNATTESSTHILMYTFLDYFRLVRKMKAFSCALINEQLLTQDLCKHLLASQNRNSRRSDLSTWFT